MKRPNRNIEIFSLSSLDLFASAMGAFVLLAVLLFPFYLKTKQIQQVSADKESQISEQLEVIAEAQRQIEMVEQIKELKSKKIRSRAELEEITKEKQRLVEKIERSVKFVFLGLPTKADSFTLVIDMSGSMKSYRSLLFDTVDRILNALQDSQSVSIIGYRITSAAGPDIRRWPANQQMQAMTKQGKQGTLKKQFCEGAREELRGRHPDLRRVTESPHRTIAVYCADDRRRSKLSEGLVRQQYRQADHRRQQRQTNSYGGPWQGERRQEIPRFPRCTIDAEQGGVFVDCALVMKLQTLPDSLFTMKTSYWERSNDKTRRTRHSKKTEGS